MNTRPRLFAGQKTCEVSIKLSEALRDELREVAAKFGLDVSSYARTLLITHLKKLNSDK